MKRIALPAVLGVALVAGGAAWWRSRPAPVLRQRGLDVLLVTIDTLRADAVGAYGQARPATPWLDRLAGTGVRFATARAHNVMTVPSHANILTGRYPFDHGIRDNAGFRLAPGLPTLATLLRAQGYRTGAFVSSAVLDSRLGLDSGFDVYDDAFARGGLERLQLPERSGAETVARARAFLAAGGEPWFCWVHLFEPHVPYEPPKPWAARYVDAPYLGEVAAADASLSALIEPLLSAGSASRTLVVLTGDHGESLGEHGERTHGLFAYEATLRVPLVVHAPRLLRPRTVMDPVRHIDILPTVLDALDLPPPDALPGRSLLPLATGRPLAPAPSYFEALSAMFNRGWAPLHGLVVDERKYVDLPLPELYDLRRDPAEASNRAAGEPRLLEELRSTLSRLRTDDRPRDPSPENAAVRERLAAVGYLGAPALPRKPRYTEADDPKRLVHLDDLMQEALARQRRGDLEGALSRAREVVRQRPDMVAALIQIARMERAAGRLAAAIEALERAVAANPEDLSALALLGSYLSEAGRLREAVVRLSPHALRADVPEDLLLALGVAFARTGRRPEALATLERARALHPGNALTLVEIATVHLAGGERRQARARLEDALRLEPGSPPAHHQLGLLALADGDAPGAETHLRAVLEQEPTHADALLNLARLLARTGRETEARPLFERFLATAPPSIYARDLQLVRERLR